MSEKTVGVFQPTYYKAFRCDPVACKETCCQRWQIFVDRETCIQYMNSKHPLIRDLAKTGISLNPEALGDQDYAKINMNKDLFCPFLNQEDLCEIVINMGEESLSKTCRTFPRAIRQVNGTFERGLVMSCSLACDLALTSEAGLAFEETVDQVDPQKLNINWFSEFKSDEISRGMLVRQAMIGIMQNRKFDLADRVLQVGCFLDQAKRKLNAEDLTRETMQTIIDGIVQAPFEACDSVCGQDLQFHHLNQILSMKFQAGDNIRFFSSRYIECLIPVLDAFGDGDEKKITSFYQEQEGRILKAYLDQKGYLIENYLANYLFVYCHEFFDWERVWEAYLKFALIFGLLKFNLIGLGVADQALDDEIVLKLIQSLAKTFVPDRQYFHSAIQYMKKEHLDDLSGVQQLIKSTWIK